MGNTQAKVRQKAITNSIAEAIYNEIKQFSNLVSVDQSQVSTGSSWMIGNSQYVQITFNVNSAASSTNLNTIGNDIATQFEGTADAKGSGLSFGTNVSSNSKADIINNIRSTVTKNSVITTMNSINTKQSQTTSGSSMQLFNSQSAAVDMIVKSIADSFNDTSLATAISNAAKNDAQSITENPLQFISDIISGLLEPFKALSWIVIGFIVLIFAAIAYAIIGGGDSQPQPYPYPPPSPQPYAPAPYSQYAPPPQYSPQPYPQYASAPPQYSPQPQMMPLASPQMMPLASPQQMAPAPQSPRV